MCFAFEAHPPELPAGLVLPSLAGGASAERLELTSPDGTRFAAALAATPRDAGAGVLILPDVRGLYGFYAELAERFAQAGHHAIAIDYFGRTAGPPPRDESFDHMPHVLQTRLEQIQGDAAAAVATLRERTGTGPVVSVGFCFGGTQSFMAATSAELDLAGAVGFYGTLVARRPGAPTVLDHTAEIRCPILGLFGGADEAIPPDQVETFDRGLSEAGIDHEIVTYPGTPHSFFDRAFAEHAEACDDAWRCVVGFVDRVGAGARG